MGTVASNAAQDIESILSKGYKDLSSQVDEILKLMRKTWSNEYIDAVIQKERLTHQINSKRVEDKIYVLQKIVLKDDSYIDDPLFAMEKIQKEITRQSMEKE